MKCEKSPLPTPVLVIVVDSHGAVAGWPLVVPGDPPIVGIPLHKTRKTLELIRQSRQFSINLVKDVERAYEIFGKPGENKLERWGNSARCKVLDCYRLGDAERVIECIYDGEIQIGEHSVVLCKVAIGYGCGDYGMWDPCVTPRRQAE